MIYARGSGQKLDEEKERDALFFHLVRGGLTEESAYTELDASQMPNSGGLSYPAIAVDNQNGPLAIVSRGHFGAYSDSLHKGKELLIHYLESSNFETCSTRLVFAGYSQGAHVITKALNDERMERFYPLISFVATFGDPSIDLKTILGGNFFGEVPWYRGNATKYISGGLVEVRNPYVPAALQDRVGAWCDEGDMICTGTPLKLLSEMINKPHSSYPLKAIPEAAAEIATRVSTDIKQPLVGPSCGTPKQDFVLAINTSPTMRTDGSFLSDAGVQKTLDGVFAGACDVQVSIVTFGRAGSEPTQVFLSPTDDRERVEQALVSLRLDEPKEYTVEVSNITSALNEAMSMPWRDDAGKAIVLMSDGHGNDAIMINNQTRLDDIAYLNQTEIKELVRLSRKLGGVEIYAAMVLHPSAEPYREPSDHFRLYEYIRPLVEATGGRVVEKYGFCGGYCSWLDMDFDLYGALTDRPRVSVPSVYVRAGEEVSLRARDVSGGVLTSLEANTYGLSYGWAVDCDAALPQAWQGEGTYRFKVAQPQTCYGAVSVTSMPRGYCVVCYDAMRHSARWLAPFRIEVVPADYVEPQAPGVIRNLTQDYDAATKAVLFTWEAPAGLGADTSDEEVVRYMIRDEDGALLGVTDMPLLRVTDVNKLEDMPLVSISVATEAGAGDSLTSADALVLAPGTGVQDRNIIFPRPSQDQPLDPVSGNADRPVAAPRVPRRQPAVTVARVSEPMRSLGIMEAFRAEVRGAQSVNSSNVKVATQSVSAAVPLWQPLILLVLLLGSIVATGYTLLRIRLARARAR